jgi:hypothetical protein
MQLAVQEMFKKKRSPGGFKRHNRKDRNDPHEIQIGARPEWRSGAARRMESWELMPLSKKYISSIYSIEELKQLARIFGGEYIEPVK